MYCYDNQLRDDDGNTLAVFSRPWAASAAMIRLSDPTFVSGWNADRPEDLAIEAQLQAKLLRQCDCCERMKPKEQVKTVIAYGIETAACEECRHA